MKISWKMKTAAAVAGMGMAIGASSASATPGMEAAPAHTEASQQVAAQSAITPTRPADVQTEAAPQALPCGFSFWHQSYRNCGGSDIFVVAPAHESATGEWFEFQYCLEPGESRQPLANWGMLVYLATHVETNC